MPRRTSRALLLAGVLALSFADEAHGGFRAAPRTISFRVEPGVSGASRVVVRNASEHPCEIQASLQDSRFGPNGIEETLAPGVLPRSLAPWLTLEKEAVTLGPFRADTLDLLLAVPLGAQGSYWAKIVLVEVGPDSVVEMVPKARQEFVVRVFEDVPGTTTSRARIVEFESEAHSARPLISVTVANEGNAILQCSARLELRDAQGRVAGKLPFARFALFPEGNLCLQSRPDSVLAPGFYTARAVLDYGGEHLMDSETRFEVAGDQK